jgi:hypothetical protein
MESPASSGRELSQNPAPVEHSEVTSKRPGGWRTWLLGFFVFLLGLSTAGGLFLVALGIYVIATSPDGDHGGIGAVVMGMIAIGIGGVAALGTGIGFLMCLLRLLRRKRAA